jgi:hypothetical protein
VVLGGLGASRARAARCAVARAAAARTASLLLLRVAAATREPSCVRRSASLLAPRAILFCCCWREEAIEESLPQNGGISSVARPEVVSVGPKLWAHWEPSGAAHGAGFGS